MNLANSGAGVGSRVLFLGLSRASLVGARAVLFIAFGLTLEAPEYALAAVLLTLGSAASVLLESGAGLLVLQRAGKNSEAVKEALGGLLVLRLAVLPAVLVLYLLAARALLGFDFDLGAAISIGLYSMLLPLVQTVFVFLRSLYLTGYEATANLLLHGTEAGITIGWAVWGDLDLRVLGAGLAFVRIACLACLLAVVVLRWRSSLSPRRAVSLLRISWRESSLLFVVTVMQFVYAQMDVLLLRVLREPVEVGTYWACYRLVGTLLMPVDLLIQAVMPRLSEARTNEARGKIFRGVHRVGFVWLAGVAILCIVEADWVVAHFLNVSYAGAGPLLALVAGAVGVSYLPPYGIGLAMGDGLPFLALACSATAVVNLALCLALIPAYGPTGAALATLGAFAVMKALFAVGFRARGLRTIPWRTVGIIVAVCATWLVFVRLMSPSVTIAVIVWGVLVAAVLAWELSKSISLVERAE